VVGRCKKYHSDGFLAYVLSPMLKLKVSSLMEGGGFPLFKGKDLFPWESTAPLPSLSPRLQNRRNIKRLFSEKRLNGELPLKGRRMQGIVGKETRLPPSFLKEDRNARKGTNFILGESLKGRPPDSLGGKVDTIWGGGGEIRGESLTRV